jgi:hypothetical protein
LYFTIFETGKGQDNSAENIDDGADPHESIVRDRLDSLFACICIVIYLHERIMNNSYSVTVPLQL